MDNSKRVSYGVSAYSDVFKLNLFQLYEFTENSNFHKDQGNETNLSDLIGSIEYLNKTELKYNFRYNMNSKYLKNQSFNYQNKTK